MRVQSNILLHLANTEHSRGNGYGNGNGYGGGGGGGGFGGGGFGGGYGGGAGGDRMGALGAGLKNQEWGTCFTRPVVVFAY